MFNKEKAMIVLVTYVLEHKLHLMLVRNLTKCLNVYVTDRIEKYIFISST